MKSTALLALLVITLPVFSQGVFSNNTNSALQKVIQDYPNKFRNIQGDKIKGEDQRVDYRSKIEVPGAIFNVVSHYTTPRKERYNWRAELFETADFGLASERFKEYYGHIKNTIVKVEGMPAFILNGRYEYPDQHRNSTSVQFDLLPANADMQNLKVVLHLYRSGNKWKVELNVGENESEQAVVAN